MRNWVVIYPGLALGWIVTAWATNPCSPLATR